MSSIAVEAFPERPPLKQTTPRRWFNKIDVRIEVLKRNLLKVSNYIPGLFNKKDPKAQKRAAAYSCKEEPAKKIRCLEPDNDDTFMDYEDSF
ncbi:unnamed protein product [Bursaphelenchus okinawaensis]|uniref:Uncharacterized protein n=1 Tax=Bursaphelenchus okinawaensis TaxID=465554 RepID=A0A811LED9_9BILA|nr:unnamed protein product [Bursaphelenchus okinawaensis]CAG9121031.1 unnamed protein product [Bursaphelenchus okinawaensis]